MKTLHSELKFKRRAIDFLILAVSFGAVYTYSNKLPFTNNDFLNFVVLSLIWYVSSQKLDLYDEFRTSKFINEIIIILPTIALQFIASISLNLLSGNLSLGFSLKYAFLLTLLLVSSKYLFKQFKLNKWALGKDLKNILIIGNGEYARAFYETIINNKQFGYNLVGIINDTPPKYVSENYLGKIEKTEIIIERYNVDEVIVCANFKDSSNLSQIIDICDKYAVRAKVIPEYFKFNTSRFKMGMFANLPIVQVREEPLEQFHSGILKRFTDVVLTTFAFIFIFSWLFPLIALAIKLDSKGPVFFVQKRWGKGGKEFDCYKFRTMLHNAPTIEKNGKFSQTVKNDPRITKIGSFLRKTNLDEFPQFINVLLGDMSIVGPRPHAVKHSIETREKIPNYLLRHLVKPGITGWAQANGYRGETTNDFLMEKRVELDIWYIENWSYTLDIRILAMTAYNMVKGEKMAY